MSRADDDGMSTRRRKPSATSTTSAGKAMVHTALAEWLDELILLLEREHARGQLASPSGTVRYWVSTEGGGGWAGGGARGVNRRPWDSCPHTAIRPLPPALGPAGRRRARLVYFLAVEPVTGPPRRVIDRRLPPFGTPRCQPVGYFIAGHSYV
jgi:hypothetical protein